MNALQNFIIIDDTVIGDPNWEFHQHESELISATLDNKNYLITRNAGLLMLSSIQVDIEYLAQTKKIEVDGVAAVSEDDLYYRIMDYIGMTHMHENQARASEVQLALEKLLVHAVSLNASDIHITRRDTVAMVEMRVNGVLVPDMQMLSSRCDEMVFVLYNVQATTRETTWNRNIPQSANILYTLEGKKYRFRYAHFPIFGETDGCYHAVLRIIPASAKKATVVDLNSLGISLEEQEDVRKILSNPYGAYIIAGTTGSGKSSTLKVLMEWMQQNRYDNKGSFLTVEDPVEYLINGTKQSSVLDGDKGGFHSAIKSSLRRDPDVLMVGEIRDPVSSGALAGAVESGHYCFTTVHAGNIVTLLQRLSALGIGSDKLSTPGFIAGLQCQKLLPVLCDHCKVMVEKVPFGGRHFTVCQRSEEGCEHCKFTGIAKRQLVIEYMRPTHPELEAISRQEWFRAYLHWRQKRSECKGLAEGFDIKEKAMSCVLHGTVCAKYFGMEFGDLSSEDMEVLLGKIH